MERGDLHRTARLYSAAKLVNALCLFKGALLASGSWDSTISLWDVATHTDTAHLKLPHPGMFGVKDLCVLADGRLAASIPVDGTIRLWDVATNAETGRLEQRGEWIGALRQLKDGRLASGSVHGTIRLWDVTIKAETGRLEGHTDQILVLSLLPDGRLVSGSTDRTIRVWDVTSGAEVARLEVDAPITALVAVGPNRLVAGDQGGRLHWLEVLD